MHLIKLKTILQSKLTLILLILSTAVYVLFNYLKLPYNTDRFGINTITGIVKQIKDNYIIIGDTVIYTDTSSIVLGQKYSCNGKIGLPEINTNFNLFNYRNYLLSKKIYYVMEGDCEVTSLNVSYLYKIKNILINKVNTLESARYIKSFILGYTDLIEAKINTNYRKNGINHLFSISGMHVGFIIGLFSFIKRKELIIFVLLLYLFLLGFPPSMSRAVFFYILLFINKKLKVNISNIQLFMYLLCGNLWVNPYLFYNIGFVYSYVISFFLIYFSECLNNKNYIISTLKISIIVFIVTIPINIQNNFYLNFVTPILNVLFIPIISFILFPLSFVVFLFPILDETYNLMCLCFENISNWCANNISVIYPFHKMNLMVFIGYYVIIVWIMHKIKFREYKYIVVLLLYLLVHMMYPNLKNDGMVLMLDVGQGDSTLVVYPHNKLNILIDTGGYYSSDIVNNITIPTLYSYGIKELDYLVLTHGDYDHCGETLNLLKKYKVKKVLLNSSVNTDLENSIIDYLEDNEIAFDYLSKEVIIHNGISMHFLNEGNINDENDDSLVLYLTVNKYNLLFMGDSSTKVEYKLLDEYNLPIMDILKVGHHGSNTSSSIIFLEKISPKISLISAGLNNRYGHPHTEILENLKLSDTYVTSIDGAIKISLGDSILVQTVR